MKYLKLAPVLLAVSISAWAQNGSDPKITSSVEDVFVPNEVTLSRNIGNAKEFIGQTAYRVKIANGAATVLNRTLFFATTSVVEALPSEALVPGATAAFDNRVPGAAIAISGQSPNCTISGDRKSLSCDFGDGQLIPGDTAEFIILVQSPEKGARLRLDWSFGGDEGKGNGNGCCTTVGRVVPDTALIDAATANSVKTHTQTFVAKGFITNLFTGVNKGATLDDPWTTIVDLGKTFTVVGGKNYVKALIDEKENLSSCSAVNKNACWQSQLTVADTTFPVNDPLWITLERHSSIIKNGTKLADYAREFVYQSELPGVGPYLVPLCAELPSPQQPTAGKPCLAPKPPNLTACVKRPDPTKASAFVYSCTVKAVENGVYARR